MRLVGINGPLAGTIVPLRDAVVLSGAHPLEAVTKPACRIVLDDNGRYVVEAIDRNSPILVNGLPVKSRALEMRDEIRVGDSVFVVRADDRRPTSPLKPCTVEIGPVRDRSPIRELEFDAAVFETDTPEDLRSGRDLATLVRAAGTLSSVRGLASLDPAVAALLLDILPANRVALTGTDESVTAVRSAWVVKESDDPPRLTIDTAVVNRVVQAKVAQVIRVDGGQAVAAPMVAFGRAVGSVWAEGSRDHPVDDRHLRLLLVVGALAAVAREQSKETARLREANELLNAEVNVDHDMVGRSRTMRSLFLRIGRIAPTDATVLVHGESGTGKELVARALHRNSRRAGRPFVAINCAALTETLLESELFGHEKGAFTGAIALKKGKLEIADGGTLFLDEIGEMPLGLQAKLLRALQEREFERVGGTRPVRVDFRLIAATNRELRSAVQAGAFRRDLFYRLNVVSLSLPALRERPEDLTLLVDHFVRKHAPGCGRRIAAVHPEFLKRLERHDWPGNVRELENVVEQALVLGAGDRVLPDDLPPGLGERSAVRPSSMNYHEGVEQTKRDLIVRALEQAAGNHTKAAQLLGVHANYLHRLLTNLNLRSRP